MFLPPSELLFRKAEERGIEKPRPEVEEMAVQPARGDECQDGESDHPLFKTGRAEEEHERLHAVDEISKKTDDPAGGKELHIGVVPARRDEGIELPPLVLLARVKARAEEGMCTEELPALAVCLEAGAARLLKIEERLHEGKDGAAEEIAKRRRGRGGAEPRPRPRKPQRPAGFSASYDNPSICQFHI